MVRMSKKQQDLFVERYIALRFNGVQAARAAGYTGDDRTLGVTACRLLRNNRVKQAIADYLEEQGATKEEVVQRLTEQSRADIAELLDSDGRFNFELAKSRGKTHLIKKLKQTTTTTKDGVEYTTVEVEMYDAQAATVQLGRARGVFVDKVAPTNPNGDGPAETILRVVYVDKPTANAND